MKSENLSNQKVEMCFDSIEQHLTEIIADFLDSDLVILQELIADIQDPEKRENTELHIRMAKAAMEEYKKTLNKQQ